MFTNLAWLLLRALGGSEEAQAGLGLAASRIEHKLLGKWAGLFWAVGIEWKQEMRFRLLWLGFWTVVQEAHVAEDYGWRRLWGLSIIWNLD